MSGSQHFSASYKGEWLFSVEIVDMLGYDSAKSDQTLVYVLTLGVVEAYRSLGIASSLIREIIKYASSIPTCGAVYLPVISYNNPAINLYKKMSFKYCRGFCTITLNWDISF
ncbi:hypothetical protein JHK87_000803 [Glycine soja]|nr:hypothetical protein JHK87_000803 [Glycine soja]